MIATTRRTSRLTRFELIAAVLFAGAIGIGWKHPEAIEPAWRCVVILALGTALGAVAVAAMHQLTSGEWGRTIRPTLAAGCRAVPRALALALPFVLARIVAQAETDFSGAAWLAGRTAVAGGGYVLLARFVGQECSENHRTRAWVAPTALIALFFLTHLFADDWLAPAHEPTGTAFPLVWLIGQSVSALALATIVAAKEGFDPRRPTGENRTLGLDLGTLLFAAAMLWCYVAFAQFLIVWSGNIPAEVTWFVIRRELPWRLVPPLLAALHLAAPMAILLSRRAKNSRATLRGIATTLLVAQCLYTVWIVLPGASDWAPVLVVAVGITLLAIFRRLWATREERAS